MSYNEIDASRVLAAALKQMDEIINGPNKDVSDPLIELPDNQHFQSPTDVVFLTKSLKFALEKNAHADGNGNQDTEYEDLDKETLLFISKWIWNELISRKSQMQRWPPAPPPRDPSGINTIVRSLRPNDPDADDMSSDSSSPPRPTLEHKRRSSYENVREQDSVFYPHKPPCSVRRSTPSPRPHPRASPCPGNSRHTSPVAAWSDADDPLGAEPPLLRRRPTSACGRAPRSHRGSMPPVECLGAAAWGHRSPCAPCCGAAVQPYHWCGAPQTWGHYTVHQSNDPVYECEDLQQKIYQLEVEKEQLAMQVNVLSEQVDAQNEKIMELENSLSQSKEQLDSSEALLRKEMTSRSSVESSKLDLMAQITDLRLRLSSVENEKREIEERNRKLENELILTAACLAEKEADLATFKSKLIRNGAITPIFDSNPEMEKLKCALSSVIAANDEKEKKIQEMMTSLNRYKKLHELVMSNHSRKNSEGFSKDEHFLSTLDNLDSCDDINEVMFDYNLSEKPPPVPRQMQQSLTLLSISEDLQRSSSRLGNGSSHSPLFSPIRGESPSPFSNLNTYRYNSSENVNPPTPQKTPPSKRHYSTLPRPHQADLLKQYIKSPNQTSPPSMASGQTSQSFHNLHNPNYEVFRPVRTKASSGMSFGKGFFRLRLGKRSSSAPELAPDKIEEISPSSKTAQSNPRRTSSPLPAQSPKEKSKGIRKIFGKVKRSGSESLNSSAAELKRGGIRATAGPRLGWSEDSKMKRNSFKVSEPFAEWNSAMICDWLLSIGLSMYIPDCKKWVKNGEQLLKATTSDFEKELNIKNPLHRKKLLLAIIGAKEQTGDAVEPAGKIDHQWVVRWLDDIGLPQYKDAFYDARIDGRMLHQLTLEDLTHLKVGNLLHHISIKTGIQVLRENNFDPHCLKRRSLPDDLYEPRFNADLMATLLNIPPNKTLLRRHLTTQFKQLIGPDIVQKKREWETQPNYLPLSPSAKVKTIKRSPFSLVKRKNKNEFDLDDYVCPMNFSEKLLGSSALLGGLQNRTEEEKFLMKEMVLKNEKILESMPASNV